MRSNLLLTSNVCTADVVISARTLQFVAVDLDEIVFTVFFSVIFIHLFQTARGSDRFVESAPML